MPFTVEKYTKNHYQIWNEFVAQAKNATFLFHRDFMEYHQDRFEDFSLLVFDESQRLKAILPANVVGTTVFSHQGLTYGGIVLNEKTHPFEVDEIIQSLSIYLKKNNILNIVLKIIPNIYTKKSTDELEITLLKFGGVLSQKDMLFVVDLREKWQLSKSKLKHFKKISSLLEIREQNNFSEFWHQILEPRLLEKYQSKPVHSLSEIQFLKERFPENIVQLSAYYNDKIVAGITLFIFDKVVKSQYGAINSDGEKVRALDYLFITLIQKYIQDGKYYFDMGTVSNNFGLMNQKLEFGCSVFSNNTYTLTL